jgi:hypothetical protein
MTYPRRGWLHLGLFRSKTFSGANLLTLLYAALGAALFSFPSISFTYRAIRLQQQVQLICH